MTDSRDDATARAASYAVGALTAAERRELEHDVRRSPRLASEVREFTETAAMLGLATEPVAPGPSLRESILGAVEATPQASRVVRGPWLSRPAAVFLGAAAPAVLAVAGTVVALEVTRPASTFEQIVAADDYERVVHEMDDGSSVTALWSISLARAALFVKGMDDLPTNRTYQAWVIDGEGHAAPAGTFVPHDGEASLTLDAEMVPGAAIGITIEPTGGSPAPTTTPLVVIPTA